MFLSRNIARSFFATNRFRNLSGQTSNNYKQMKFKFLITFLIIFCSGRAITAQKVTQAETKYKAGVADYTQKRYAAAMEKLSPLTIANPDVSYATIAPFAHYYYSLSAYQIKRYRESKQMLLQLMSRYPGWAKINDVYYLLGANQFATGQNKEALETLLKIKDSSLAKDVQTLKQYHLSLLDGQAKLRELQKQYPNDRDIAVVLVQMIESSKSSSKTDLQFASQLEKQFKISRSEKAAVMDDSPKTVVPKNENQWKKGYFDVAVLLPFRLDEFSTSKRRTNQFAYDYYLGLNVAKEKLKSEGINVNLWAYDVGNDAKPMNDIVSNTAFQKSDIVIGPLYTGTFDVTAEAISKSGMIMLNPLSTDPNLLKAGSNIYLAHPGIPFQIQKAVQWMKIAASGSPAAIYYGNTSKDSVMAFAYSEEWKAKGGKVLEMLKIRAEREWLETKISTFEAEKPAHIALFSTDMNTGTMLIEVVNGRKLLTTPILATSTSFNMQQSRMAKYGSRLYLIETDYVDRYKEGIREFQKTYWNKTNTFPSVYSYQGYDQLLFFGRMLNQYKDGIQKGIQSRKHTGEDYLLSGFDFTKSNDNQISPVLRYGSSGKWVPVN
jgi:ABC-type branched-subunit amino acid transport system substrate-binding protein